MEKTMQSCNALEYMCPYCGAVNSVELSTIKEMYREQETSCGCCNKSLSLTPANGTGGKINLVIDPLEVEK